MHCRADTRTGEQYRGGSKANPGKMEGKSPILFCPVNIIKTVVCFTFAQDQISFAGYQLEIRSYQVLTCFFYRHQADIGPPYYSCSIFRPGLESQIPAQ